ncbi:MAG: UbiD family decarboxylase [Planctomycetaceae bacterium]|nr:UbiD family decarboxylase [Planctomycetaceae bacterium]
MGYRSLRACLEDLRRTGRLIEITQCVDPHLEMAAIQRRVYAAGGPALWFSNVQGCRFSMASNLFGTRERIHYIFRDAVKILPRILRLGVDPGDLMRRPGLYLTWRTPWAGWCSQPKRVRTGPVFQETCTLSELPHLHSWPKDGGAYITLPQVYSESPDSPGLLHSNLGMYRIQLNGNDYSAALGQNEVGIHYQIHRGIGIHHAQAIARGEKLRVNVFVGGPPAMALAAVMPLPEGMSELLFAGILNQRRIRMANVPRMANVSRTANTQSVGPQALLPVSAEADFALCGWLDPDVLKREGPFGDHLGYYSLEHDFPVLHVEKIFCRRDAVWPFTVVGRPPQEDSMIGEFIHEMVRDLMPNTIPGVREVHAVDDCGVHPLLLAIGSERYVPYQDPRRPMELLTLANAILGTGQLSLAKYLLIAAGEDDPELHVQDVPRFLLHMLQRADWRTDLHFQTGTTTDTLDYSGGGFNRGSKLVISAAGPIRRTLPRELPLSPSSLPAGSTAGLGAETFGTAANTDSDGLAIPEKFQIGRRTVILPGILLLEAPPWRDDGTQHDAERFAERFCAAFSPHDPLNAFPLIVLTDRDSCAPASVRDFLWTTFTKSDPARDVFGIGPTVENRHVGFEGSLLIDARRKTFHAPELEEDPEITRRVEALAAPGGPLHGIY